MELRTYGTPCPILGLDTAGKCEITEVCGLDLGRRRNVPAGLVLGVSRPLFPAQPKSPESNLLG